MQVKARAKFLIRLANSAPLAAMKIHRIARLFDEQRRFMGLPAEAFGHLPFHLLDRLGIRLRTQGQPLNRIPKVVQQQTAELEAMRLVARELLEALTAGRPIEAEMNGDVYIRGNSIGFRGAPVDAFRMTSAWLLADNELRGLIRECPECRRFFVRQGRQLYCRRRCTNQATWRNYPEGRKLKARRRQYAKFGWTLGARRKSREA